METSTLQETVHGPFTASGLELLHGKPIYRGTVDSPLGGGRRHNVFIAVGDGESPSIMSTFGDADKINPDYLEAVRTPSDGYDVTVISGSGAFIRHFTTEEVLADPSRIVDAAIQIGQYADQVEVALQGIPAERQALASQLQTWCHSDNWDMVSSGRVSVDAFTSAADRFLVIVPDRDLWATILDAANRAAIDQWSTGTSMVADSPWSKIAAHLRRVGDQRGWELQDDD